MTRELSLGVTTRKQKEALTIHTTLVCDICMLPYQVTLLVYYTVATVQGQSPGSQALNSFKFL